MLVIFVLGSRIIPFLKKKEISYTLNLTFPELDLKMQPTSVTWCSAPYILQLTRSTLTFENVFR